MVYGNRFLCFKENITLGFDFFLERIAQHRYFVNCARVGSFTYYYTKSVSLVRVKCASESSAIDMRTQNMRNRNCSMSQTIFLFHFWSILFSNQKKNWTKIKKIQKFLVLNVEISEWQFTLKINPHFTTRRPKKTKQNKTKSNGVEQWFLVSTGKTDLAKK